jgi:hypothetical protein
LCHLPADDGGYHVQPSQLSRSPAPLARDQLIAIVTSLDQHGLEHAVAADGIRQFPQRVLIEPLSHLRGRRSNLI